MNLPRMRTIPETVAELKEADPHTAITAFAIRRMVKCGEIPHIRAGQKILNNLDKLLEHLSNPTDPVPERDYGRIRPIDARRA